MQFQAVLVGMIVLMLGMGSLAMWGYLISQMLVTGRQPIPWNWEAEYQRDRNPIALVLTVIWVLGLMAGTAVVLVQGRGAMPEPSLRMVHESVASNVVISLFFLFLLANFGRTPLREVGMDFSHPLRDLTYAGQGCLASFLPVYAVSILLVLVGVRKAENQHVFIQLVKDNSSGEVIFWMFLAAGVMAPLAEELLFRVILQGWAERFLPPAASIIGVAAIFSFVHGWPDMMALFPLALILGYVYHRQRRFLTVFLLHMIFNSLNLIIAMLSSPLLPE